MVSPTEFRLRLEEEPPVAKEPPIKADPFAMIGFAQRHGLPVMTTAEWMKLIREGEED